MDAIDIVFLARTFNHIDELCEMAEFKIFALFAQKYGIGCWIVHGL